MFIFVFGQKNLNSAYTVHRELWILATFYASVKHWTTDIHWDFIFNLLTLCVFGKPTVLVHA